MLTVCEISEISESDTFDAYNDFDDSEPFDSIETNDLPTSAEFELNDTITTFAEII
jgi:hypothetical protein